MDCKRVKFSRHALERMFERMIAETDVLDVLRHGQTVEEYNDDTPYPSQLLLGWCGGRPLHVVAAHDQAGGLCIVITAYLPDATQWGDDFKTRRQT
jgi:hypothetical protein